MAQRLYRHVRVMQVAQYLLVSFATAQQRLHFRDHRQKKLGRVAQLLELNAQLMQIFRFAQRVQGCIARDLLKAFLDHIMPDVAHRLGQHFFDMLLAQGRGV